MRYEVRDDGPDGRFEFIVVDTAKPRPICMVFSRAEANKICEALNEHDEAPIVVAKAAQCGMTNLTYQQATGSPLSLDDQEEIKQWMYESLDGNGILEDGDLSCVARACQLEGQERRDVLDAAMNHIYEYAHSVLYGVKDG